MKGVVAIGSVDDDLVTPGGDGEMAMTAATATPPTAEIRPTAGTHPTADPAPPTSPPTTSGRSRSRSASPGRCSYRCSTRPTRWPAKSRGVTDRLLDRRRTATATRSGQPLATAQVRCKTTGFRRRIARTRPVESQAGQTACGPATRGTARRSLARLRRRGTRRARGAIPSRPRSRARVDASRRRRPRGDEQHGVAGRVVGVDDPERTERLVDDVRERGPGDQPSRRERRGGPEASTDPRVARQPPHSDGDEEVGREQHVRLYG